MESIKKIVVCPFHFAEFDVTSGQKIKDPHSESFENLDKLPEEMEKFLIYAKKLVDPVKTYDMQTHEVKVEGDKILIRIDINSIQQSLNSMHSLVQQLLNKLVEEGAKRCSPSSSHRTYPITKPRMLVFLKQRQH
jgi:nitrite reductase/ring-hydroxylating ferredoxin subunit